MKDDQPDEWVVRPGIARKATPAEVAALAEAALHDDWPVRPMAAKRQTKREKRAAYHAAKAALRRPPKPVATTAPRATFRFMVEGVGVERHTSIADARKAHPGRVVRRATAKE